MQKYASLVDANIFLRQHSPPRLIAMLTSFPQGEGLAIYYPLTYF